MDKRQAYSKWADTQRQWQKTQTQMFRQTDTEIETRTDELAS